MFVRDSAALALEGLAVAQDDELRRQIQRVLDAEPSMVMTPAAWSLYARSADRNEQFRILERGVALSGFARVGIESLADAACAPALHDVFRLAPQSVSGSYLRQSACVALFNIGTPAAWQSFELILEDAPLGSDAWIALSGETFDYPPKPQNLANVLECAARWTTVRPEALPALRSSIDRTKAALDRCTVPRRIVRQTCMELRSLAPKFGHDEESLRIALEVLAEHGDGEDQRFVRDWLWKLSEPARDAIESRLSIAR
jgi:hypothetical protein